MQGEYIKHHGIKGMKWGVRRTDAQLGNGGTGGSNHKSAKPKTTDDYRRMKKTTDQASTYVESAKKAKANSVKKQQQESTKKKLESMSDAELRAVVNRLNMEERYKDVMNSRAADVGKDRTTKLLEAAGTALTITSSALSLAIAIKELQK